MFSWWHFRSGHRVRSVSFKKYVDMIMYDQDGQGQVWVFIGKSMAEVMKDSITRSHEFVLIYIRTVVFLEAE